MAACILHPRANRLSMRTLIGHECLFVALIVYSAGVREPATFAGTDSQVPQQKTRMALCKAKEIRACIHDLSRYTPTEYNSPDERLPRNLE
jgi:hypothetical protein